MRLALVMLHVRSPVKGLAISHVTTTCWGVLHRVSARRLYQLNSSRPPACSRVWSRRLKGPSLFRAGSNILPIGAPSAVDPAGGVLASRCQTFMLPQQVDKMVHQMEQLFSMALGLAAPWTITRIELSGADLQAHV